MKKCSQCGQLKSLTEFFKDRWKTDGYKAACKGCYHQDRTKMRIAKRKRQAARPDHYRELNRTYKRRYKYGLAHDDWLRMKEAQKGVCAICGKAETRVRCGVVVDLSVDHDHKTGAVRGLLCARCNLLLGAIQDDVGVLLEAASYLLKHSSGAS